MPDNTLTASARLSLRPASICRVPGIIHDMLTGNFSAAAKKLTASDSTACWPWLLPMHLFPGTVGLGLYGHYATQAQIFSKLQNALGAAAILWCEHFIILMLLINLLLALTGCRIRPVRVFESTCAAVLPMAVSSVPAACLSLVSDDLAASVLLFGIILSAFLLWSVAETSGVTRAKGGRLLFGLTLLADLLVSSVIINSML